MSTDSSVSILPLRVWFGRHLVVVSALVLVAAYLQEGRSLPSLWTYLGQLGGAIGFSFLLAAVVTLFASQRDVRSLTVRATSVLWVAALLLLLGSLVPTLTNQPINSRSTESGLSGSKITVTVESLRARYPDKLKDKSDIEVARIAHPALAPDMTFDEFARRLGVK